MIQVREMAAISRFPRLFEAGMIGSMEVRNRTIMAAMGRQFNSDTGAVTQRTIDYFVERAKGGVGLITTGVCLPERRISGWGGALILDNDRYISGHFELTSAVHFYGARISLQLCLPGRHATPSDTEGRQPVAPSPIAEMVPGLAAPGALPPRELTLEEIGELVEQFGAAALRARAAGYDAVEIHGAHGYLIHQFMSERTNRRSDGYGGSRENRIRFAEEIIRRVKERAGRDFPVILKFTAEETVDSGGYTIEDARFFARRAEAAGVDALEVSMGTFEDIDGVSRNVCPSSYPQGWRIPYVKAIKQMAKVPIIAVGAIREPDFAESILREGKADFIALGRPLLADPAWPNKAAEGHLDDIRKCPSCCYCLHAPRVGLALLCATNAEVGREGEYSQLQPANPPKKVMIAGSGPAGLEAARIASLRGHHVALYEKGAELGAGQLSLVSVSPGKEKMRWVKEYLVNQVQKLDIDVHLNTEATEDTIESEKPDVLIVATGAKPVIPGIAGLDNVEVVTSHDVLGGPMNITGKTVAVLGGWSNGCETALYLVEKDNNVLIVSRSPRRNLARGIFAANRYELMAKLRRNPKVTILHEHDVSHIDKGGEIVLIDKERNVKKYKVDLVVLARGVAPVRELAEEAKGKVKEIYVIGDAAEPRNIPAAISEGAKVARII